MRRATTLGSDHCAHMASRFMKNRYTNFEGFLAWCLLLDLTEEHLTPRFFITRKIWILDFYEVRNVCWFLWISSSNITVMKLTVLRCGYCMEAPKSSSYNWECARWRNELFLSNAAAAQAASATAQNSKRVLRMLRYKTLGLYTQWYEQNYVCV